MPSSSLWSRGWWRVKGVWQLPPEPRARKPGPIDEDAVWRCILCKKIFADGAAFHAHQILIFTPAERCLDRHELTALDFQQNKSGVWSIERFTQYQPHQIARLASVRATLERLNRGLPFPLQPAHLSGLRSHNEANDEERQLEAWSYGPQVSGGASRSEP